MKKQVTHIQLILGICCVVIGLAVIVAVSGTVRFLGLVFLMVALWLLAGEIYSRLGSSDDDSFRSHTRDRILRHQYKK